MRCTLMTESEKKFNAIILSPSGEKPNKMKVEDVWGEWNEDRTEKISEGMVVTRGRSDRAIKCPHFKDVLPYKSVTVVCEKSEVDDVMYWLEYVHGAECVENIIEIGDGKVAIRSNYMAW